MSNMTPAELRAEADRIDAEQGKSDIGTVLIHRYTGWAIIHDGGPTDHRRMRDPDYREATADEVKALQTIPEFSAHLARRRGGA
jgi:hypothetical protein